MGSRKVYTVLILFSLSLLVTAFIVSTPAEIFTGMKAIILSEGTLISDFFAIAGPGAALFNSALVSFVSIALLYFSRDPVCGATVMAVGLMAGFALFGKNIVNIWPIIFGTWLYAVYQKESFMSYTPVALLGTTLSPFVSFIALRQGGTPEHLVLALIFGLAIGFLMPALSEYTFRIHNGMNLYNTGFAAGLFAMVLVPIVMSFGSAPESAYFWSTQYHNILLIYLILLLAALFISAFVADRHVLKAYKALITSRGHVPNDYLERFGAPAVLLNSALCGALALFYILVTGGVLNGPMLGAVFSVICFASSGKNPRNMAPIMLGVFIGSVCNTWKITEPAVQLAGLFCTTLAPITDYFGIIPGILAGFLHSAVVLYAGSPLAGLNLYNNGFAGGIVATVLYPVLSKLIRHKRARIENMDYIDIFK